MAMAGSGSTIFAVASGAGRAGVAVIRISGPEAGPALERLSGRALPPPRRATLCTIHSATGEALDRGLCLWFPAPASFTGEDVVELHCHGGRAVLLAVGEALLAVPGVRPAGPGEFTRRAFGNGKMDLTAAEAIADLVEAETELQRRQALRQMDGVLGRLYETWRSGLLEALAQVEAAIDFPDEDLPDGLVVGARGGAAAVAAALRTHLADHRAGQVLRDGCEIVILGEPNVGKSSLFNALVGRDAAIVTALPGTTRDVVEARLDLGGYPVMLADTAGLRDGEDEVEREGIRRARLRAGDADLALLVLDARTWPYLPPALEELTGPRTILVWNKADLVADATAWQSEFVSAVSGRGVDALLQRTIARLQDLFPLGNGPSLTRTRHRAALVDCLAALDRFLAGQEVEMAAEDLRLAIRALGRITGRVDVEDMLDVLFGAFCIGK
jgi:tRNA modification GTPase